MSTIRIPGYHPPMKRAPGKLPPKRSATIDWSDDAPEDAIPSPEVSEDTAPDDADEDADDVTFVSRPRPERLAPRRAARKYFSIARPDIVPGPEFSRVLDALERSNTNLFVTGKAGTGKSTLLQYFRATTAKNVAILAPTGVAALNVGGQTIHSFFKFGTEITLEKVKRVSRSERALYEKLDAIVIDEISMVRADLFDCIEKFLRLNGRTPGEPWGGTQVIAFGDLFQLPPVVPPDERHIFEEHYPGPYFFNAFAYDELDLALVELATVYRQSDAEFIAFLDQVRRGSIASDAIARFNSTTVRELTEADASAIVLVPTNAQADAINRAALQTIAGTERTYRGAVEGAFAEREFPTALSLALRIGAQVMLLKNDPEGRYVNGDLAVVEKLSPGSVRVRFPDGSAEEIVPARWEKVRHAFDPSEGAVRTEIVGAFTQLPLRLSWAVTIHKGQGKTFDRVRIDLGRGAFAPGQMYVALSRCRSMEGIALATPMRERDVIVDARIREFLARAKRLS